MGQAKIRRAQGRPPKALSVDDLRESVDKVGLTFKGKVKGIELRIIRTPTAPDGSDNYTAMLVVDGVIQALGNFQPWHNIALLMSRFHFAGTAEQVAEEFAAFHQSFTKEEILKRIQEKEPPAWWYISMASEKGFLGGCFVEAAGHMAALDKIHKLGIYPKGSGAETMSRKIGAADLPTEDYRNRLLSREELETAWGPCEQWK